MLWALLLANKDERGPEQRGLLVRDQRPPRRRQRLARRPPLLQLGIEGLHEASGAFVVDLPQAADNAAAARVQEGTRQPHHALARSEIALARLAGGEDDEVD